MREHGHQLSKRVDAAKARAREAREARLRDHRQSGVQFLRTELRTTLVLAEIAARNGNRDKRRRNLENARRGYDALMRFLPRVMLTRAESEEIEAGINRLRNTLRELGETI